ncbi:MAG TPA: hypothetical protein VHB79_28215 [Polyangiaceae bacterium]|nr:hypothetical protein [Polyangiaceae bacterium]
MRLRSLSGVCVVSLVVVATASACGSSDDKKKQPGESTYPGSDGGAGGDAPSNTSGKAGSSGTPHAGEANGGQPMSGEGGVPSSSPGGAGGATPSCPDGFGDCDDNPADCETPLDTVTACGACDVSCDGSHGSVACTDGKCVIDSCADGYDSCDNDTSTGCETKLDSNQACGACTRNCATAGATCDTGMCSAPELSPHGQAWEATYGGGAVFVMKVNASPVSHYTLTRIPTDGSAEKQIWDADAGVGDGVLYADATDLYWAVSGNPPSVLKKAVSAASNVNPTVVFQPTLLPKFLTIHGNAYFWMTGMYGAKASLFTRATNALMANTGTEIMTVDQGYVTSFALTSDAVYWVARSNATAHLSYVPLAGGAPKDVPDAVVVDTAALFAMGDTLYFARTGSNANVLNGLYKFKQGDATVTQLVQQEGVRAIAADATGVYFAAGYDGYVYKEPLAGGVAPTKIAKVPSFAGFAGQDDKLLYTFNGWGSAGSAYKIVK